MHILEAILAFALTMAIFSTLTTFAIQILSTLFARREQAQRLMLGQYFDRVLCDTLVKQDDEPARKPLRKNFTRHMTVPYLDDVKATGIRVWFRGETTLSNEEFVRRLARSDVGEKVVPKELAGNERNARIKLVLHTLIQRLNGLTKNAQQRFRAHSRLASALIAVVMAISLNIDAFRLFTQFLENPVMTQALTETNVAKEVLKGELEKALQNNDGAAEKKIAELRTRIAELHASGLAIGHGYYPFCDGSVADDNCAAARKQIKVECGKIHSTASQRLGSDGLSPRDREIDSCVEDKLIIYEDRFSFRWIEWALWVFVTGLLIGLGGPFWFDFYAGFSRVVGLLRTLRGGTAKPIQVKTDKDGDEEAIDVEALTEIFQQEHQAKSIFT